MEAAGALDIDYWLRDDTAQDGLSGCSNTLAGLGVGLLIEAGPGSTMARELAGGWPGSADGPVVLSTLSTPDSAEPDGAFPRAVAGAYEAGLDIAFTGLFAGEARRRISLPTYPFQRRRHWI